MTSVGFKARFFKKESNVAQDIDILGPRYSMTLMRMLLSKFATWYLIMAVSIMLVSMLQSLSNLAIIRSGIFPVDFWITILDVASVVPSVIRDFSPFIALFGTMFAMIQMHGRGELLAVRTSGMSVWEMMPVPALFCLLFGVLVIIFAPTIHTLEQRFKKIQNTSLSVKEIYGAVQGRIEEIGISLKGFSSASRIISSAALETVDIGTWIAISLSDHASNKTSDSQTSNGSNSSDHGINASNSDDSPAVRMILRVGDLSLLENGQLQQVDALEINAQGNIRRFLSLSEVNVDGGRWSAIGREINLNGNQKQNIAPSTPLTPSTNESATSTETSTTTSKTTSTTNATSNSANSSSLSDTKRFDFNNMPDLYDVLLVTRDGMVLPIWSLPALANKMRSLGMSADIVLATFHKLLIRPLWLFFMAMLAIYATYFMLPRADSSSRQIMVIVASVSVVLNIVNNLMEASVSVGIVPVYTLWVLPIIGIMVIVALILRKDYI